MAIRYPRPLGPGSVVGVTCPSAGVREAHHARLEFSIERLKTLGFDVVVGECMSGDGVTSAPAAARARELTTMLLDPSIAAIVPPWGGKLAVEILPYLDFDRIAQGPPTWMVGYSDISTLLVPMTLLTGIATIHGQNLMEAPYALPPQVTAWYETAGLHEGSRFTQHQSPRHSSKAVGHDDVAAEPTVSSLTLDEPGDWKLLAAESELEISGRLIGGCIETVSVLAGTPYGDMERFAQTYGNGDGLLLYLEAAGQEALDIARALWRMRLAGWFSQARAVLIGRTHAPDSGGFTQRDAVVSVLSDLGIPIVFDVDCGHVPPGLSLLNGALATVTVRNGHGTIAQQLS